MNSKTRMKSAMGLSVPDRVPLMCQLSLGHYFLNADVKPFDIWYTSEGFADALIRMQQRYSFDGILVNLPGRDKNIESQIDRIKKDGDDSLIYWKNGCYTVFPKDDNPHYYHADGSRPFPSFDEIDPEKLFYIEPFDVTEIKYPYYWGFENELPDYKNFFPSHHLDTLKILQSKVGENISIHSEIFSPWSQFLDLLNYENALIATIDDPGKVKACLERLTEGTIALAMQHASLNVDAILISSAFAGAGLISREDYENLVLPYERKIITEIKKQCDIPIYTHTCGSIGDRLDLMLLTGTNGIDTLDPPPLGTVELSEAKKILSAKAFIKGNIDPVNTLLYGNAEQIEKDVINRIEIGKEGGGYILSSACSVAPHTPPQNIFLLKELVERYGCY